MAAYLRLPPHITREKITSTTHLSRHLKQPDAVFGEAPVDELLLPSPQT
jgi:hypothetical protein